ncbi:SCO2522 family protein [Nocardia acidivorans]|uniref:SCO2522 family protein n=1 Tax=Nocardia acidivorans TaxID=404580 RepID=UPI00083307C9|nr:SCO2522 family protein [Nocardia acidivorans]
MSSIDYSEAAERNRVAGQPLSHVSIEAGHFYMDDLVNGIDRIKGQFRRVAPLVEAHRQAARAEFGPGARVSTCFLIDDYFRHDTSPAEILRKLLDAADECGVRIDYLAREAGCAEVPVFIDGESIGDPIRLAEMMAARIVPEPEDQQSTGRRPATAESGWLCNGRRSSEYDAAQAMRVAPYRPPVEFAARNHSIFLDVQLWNRWTESVGGEQVERTRWSCPFLASIWQLLRLGMIRHEGAVVAAPVPEAEVRRPNEEAGPGGGAPAREWPADWWKMPAVVQLNPAATPFAAYRTLSVLPHSYLGIEHAVRVILDHLQLDSEVYDKLAERGAAERIPVSVPARVTHRVNHVFIGDA